MTDWEKICFSICFSCFFFVEPFFFSNGNYFSFPFSILLVWVSAPKKVYRKLGFQMWLCGGGFSAPCANRGLNWLPNTLQMWSLLCVVAFPHPVPTGGWIDCPTHFGSTSVKVNLLTRLIGKLLENKEGRVVYRVDLMNVWNVGEWLLIVNLWLDS